MLPLSLYAARRYSVPLDGFPTIVRVETAARCISKCHYNYRGVGISAVEAADSERQPDSVSS
jgi:hypothetical protein